MNWRFFEEKRKSRVGGAGRFTDASDGRQFVAGTSTARRRERESVIDRWLPLGLEHQLSQKENRQTSNRKPRVCVCVCVCLGRGPFAADGRALMEPRNDRATTHRAGQSVAEENALKTTPLTNGSDR